MTGILRPLPPEAQAELAEARRLLESPGLAMQLANVIGAPIEGLMARLPGPAARLVDRAARKAVETAFDAARRTLRTPAPGDTASPRLHKFAVAGTGAVGGALAINSVGEGADNFRVRTRLANTTLAAPVAVTVASSLAGSIESIAASGSGAGTPVGGKTVNGYGYYTWTDNRMAPDTFWAVGYGGQRSPRANCYQ